MTREKSPKEIPTWHRALYPVYRVEAMLQVACELDVQVEIVKVPGEKYKDVEVPENMQYVCVDVKDKGDEFRRRVDEIAPPKAAS